MDGNTVYKLSFTGGTVFGMIPGIRYDDLVLTLIMATTGAIASFLVSLLLKWVMEQLKK
ncbi:hypothetical protein P278_14920 [Zhouia amylolytica AD3]|uniref:Uncharacterized protein n=2 Tax=Zhouia amylolytica TaxID=376730 RepID=W2UNQ3_9FLAO|nr:hypothetical protein P278_14920 [Zhouia amylolytica AD3]